MGLSRIAALGAALVGFTITGSSLSAAVVALGPNSTSPYVTTYTNIVISSDLEVTFGFGDASSPYAFSQSNSASYWSKVIDLGSNTLDYNHELVLNEYVQVAGDQAFTDWHENLALPTQYLTFHTDPDDVWYALASEGYAIQHNAEDVLSPDGKTIDFAFAQPIPVGAEFLIHNEIINLDPSFASYQGLVIVNQYPTVPEPASVSVLALGAMGLLARRRR